MATTTSLSYSFTGLSCGTTYTVAVTAYDAAGNQSKIAYGTGHPTTAACTDTTPPASPSGLAASGVTSTAATLTWAPSTDNAGVAGYHVSLDSVRVATTTATRYDATGLTCGTSHTVAVDAYDAAGNTSAAAGASFRTTACADSSPPSVPPNERYSAIGQTSATLAWDASTDNVGVAGYRLYLNGQLAGTTTALSYTFSGLSCGTSYTVAITSYDAAGNASDPASGSGTATTSGCAVSDSSPPTIPTGLAQGATTGTSVSVTWSASSDNVGVTGYGVFRNGSSVGSATTGTRSYTIVGLTCGTSYSVSVDAFDAAGNRSAKASVSVATSACAAPAPPPPPAPAGSANLWVDTSGGSCVRQASAGGYVDAQACSWNQAYQAAQTGDLILVKGGSYGNVTIGPNKPSIAAPGVTFRTASGESVVVNDLANGYISGAQGGSNVSFVGPVRARTFRSDQASNVVVDGWTVDCNGCDGEQMFHVEAADNVVVRNSDISDNMNNSLIWIDGTNITFENNQIHDAGLPSGSASHTECMYVHDVTNLTLKRNHFYHCSVMDVFITGSDVSSGGYVENNVFEKPWENTGVISNSALAFHFRNGGSPSPDPSNWDFRYNTFVGPLSITPSENPVGPGGLRVIGNVFLSGDPCGLSNTTYDYNAFLTGQGCGTHTIGNSLAGYLAGFTNTGDPGNYSLKAASALRDKGNLANYPTKDNAGSSRYTGVAPDLGAYEGT